MYDLECTLLSFDYKKDSNGNILKDSNGREIKEKQERPVPILNVEKVWKDEFYKANQIGMKPSLRIKLSSLNYEDEEELIYMNNKYSVIRTDGDNPDEIILICERKLKNVKF